jgi:hypothetical protein
MTNNTADITDSGQHYTCVPRNEKALQTTIFYVRGEKLITSLHFHALAPLSPSGWLKTTPREKEGHGTMAGRKAVDRRR